MARITAELREGTRVEISNGRHTWHADEPESVPGGKDSAPNPYELLLGSVAACTCMTLALYCRHKDISFQYFTVEYNHDRVHADDCERCDDEKEGYLDRVKSQIVMVGDFDEAQQERLAQIATRCPVHKTLENGVHFEDSVSFE